MSAAGNPKGSRLQAYWAAVIRDLDVQFRTQSMSRAYWASVIRDLTRTDYPGVSQDIQCIKDISYIKDVIHNSSPVLRGYDSLYPPIKSKEEFLSLLDESDETTPLITEERKFIFKDGSNYWLLCLQKKKKI